ncbi:MAG: glycosyltransferase family 4 protein [Patescibacteria group bacterium]|nr:glycosyltransferase family 4 protein [Patescibacteria group bacterium]
MRILFLSHSYPPIVGGVENHNCSLASHLKEISDVTVLANSKGKKALPFFLIYTFVRSFFAMTRHDVCLCGSGVLAPLCAVLRFFHPQKRFYCVTHGLDVTYAERSGFLPLIYRKINIPSLKKMDRIFMVGNPTVEEAVKQGVPRDKCVVIPNGVDPGELQEKHSRAELEGLLKINLEDKKVILRLGRFVPHKGTSWFIKSVMPLLPDSVIFVVAGNRVSENTAGDKDDYPLCEKIIKEEKLEKRVLLLPSLPQKDLKILLNTVDLVVSPNIKVPGTMEGFGINVIEAGVCGRFVVASDLEGLADAIENGQNGILIEPENAEHWQKKIQAIFDAGGEFIEKFGDRAADYVERRFSWDSIAKRFLDQMK